MLMNCLYTFKDQADKHYTYEELVELFQSSGISHITDIVYSADETETRQNIIYGKLKDLKVEGKYSDTVSKDGGEPNISDESSISCQDLVNMPIYASKAKTYQRMDDDDYIQYKIAELTSGEDPKSAEQAEYIARKDVENWKIIGSDAADLHKLIGSFIFSQSNDIDDFKDHLKGTKFENVSGQIYNTLKEFRISTLGKIAAKNSSIPSQVIYGLNIKTELKGIDKNLFGHIDMVVVVVL